MPEVPLGWKPDPRRVWQKDPNVDDTVVSTSTRANMFGKKKLTADQVIFNILAKPITDVILDSVVPSSVKRRSHRHGLYSTTYPKKTANASSMLPPVSVHPPLILRQLLRRPVHRHLASLTPPLT
jgi:hypothetical protein